MIFIEQGGRCGNQMFSYAVAKRILKEYPDEKLTFVLSAIKDKSSNLQNGQFWEDSLQYFNVLPYKISMEKSIVKKYGNKVQIGCWILFRIGRKVNTLLSKHIEKEFSRRAIMQNEIIYSLISRYGVYYITHGFVKNIKHSKVKNKFIYGSFEDIRWFDIIRDDLIKDFSPKHKINPVCRDLYEQISTTNSVCISMRKWSIDVHEKEELQKREICTKEYYRKAINYIENCVENPVYFVFSDDIPWAIKFIKDIINGNSTVIGESGDNNVAEKLYMMSACKHFIVANSTFSWWAVYLSQYDNKIVVSPSKWFNSNYEFHPLILRNWTTIEC